MEPWVDHLVELQVAARKNVELEELLLMVVEAAKAHPQQQESSMEFRPSRVLQKATVKAATAEAHVHQREARSPP